MYSHLFTGWGAMFTDFEAFREVLVTIGFDLKMTLTLLVGLAFTEGLEAFGVPCMNLSAATAGAALAFVLCAGRHDFCSAGRLANRRSFTRTSEKGARQMEKKTQGATPHAAQAGEKKLFWGRAPCPWRGRFCAHFSVYGAVQLQGGLPGLFQGDQELRDVVELMLSGHDVVGAERLNNSQRKIIKTFVHNMEDVPATIALGSSRVMMISSEMLKTDSFTTVPSRAQTCTT